MVLFNRETQIIKNHIINDRFLEAKTEINTLIIKARSEGFGVDGYLVGELLHLKVHVNAYLGIDTKEPSYKEFPNKITANNPKQKEVCKTTIDVIRKIQ